MNRMAQKEMNVVGHSIKVKNVIVAESDAEHPDISFSPPYSNRKTAKDIDETICIGDSGIYLDFLITGYFKSPRSLIKDVKRKLY